MVLPDTDVWIRWLRARATPRVRDGETRPRLFLTTIALQELWAGVAPSSIQARDLGRLYQLTATRRRIVNPPAAAWVLSGHALWELANQRRLSGARLRSLRNDVLLAATALAYGASVLTYNRTDFTLISNVLPVTFRIPGHDE